MRDGEPCSHRGCLSHISHPCEGCGRIGGKTKITCTLEELLHIYFPYDEYLEEKSIEVSNETLNLEFKKQ